MDAADQRLNSGLDGVEGKTVTITIISGIY